MSRSFRKAVAFIAFVAMALQLFVTPDITPVKAAESVTEFVYSDYDHSIIDVVNPSSALTVPSEETDSVSLSLYGMGVKSVTVEKGIKYVSLWGVEDLEEISLPSTLDTLYITGATKLKNLVIPKGTTSVSLSEFAGETLDVPSSVSYLYLDYCNSLKKANLNTGLSSFCMWGCPNLTVTIPTTVNEIYCDSYKGVSFAADHPKYSKYEDSIYEYDNLWLAASDRKEINVKPGTKAILSGALTMAYAATSINIPDSVELLDYGALAGATKVKKLKLPKNLMCIYNYAFDGLGADSIEIPTSVQYVEENAFGGYKGVVNLENGYNYVINAYKGAIYNWDYSCLLYYPKTRTSLNLDFDCLTIAYSAINGCAFKTLDLPEGMSIFNCDLRDCKKLKTINIPSSVWWISEELTYNTPVSLTKYTVDKKNSSYSSYEGCLYSKDKGYLYSIPLSKSDVKVARGCVTIPYYAFGYRETYDENGDYLANKLNVELPGTIASIDGLYNIGYAKVDCGTTAARLIQDYNRDGWYSTISYEFVDSSKDILRKIVVFDDIQIKKTDKNEVVSYTLPDGLNSVEAFTPLHMGTNVYVKVSFTSAKKSVCKVNKKTGKLTPVKKGTATIRVKCELPDGTSKTFKTKVTVK